VNQLLAINPLTLLGPHGDLFVVLALLIAAILMFMRNQPRMDVVALMMIAALPFTGVVSISETLRGFSDPNVVLIALLFVLGEGLSRTGLVRRVGDLIYQHAGNHEVRLIVLIMLSVAILGSVMSSTAVIAIFIPVVLRICQHTGISPSKLMMPLSIGALISGMLTLVATSPNLIVDAELQRQGFEGFDFFTITPIGLTVLATAVLYTVVARKWLPDRSSQGKKTNRQFTFQDWFELYRLHDRELRVQLRPDSICCGQALESLPLRSDGINLLAIERDVSTRQAGLFNVQKRILLKPQASTRLAAGDILLLDAHVSGERIEELLSLYSAVRLPLAEGVASLASFSQDLGMIEAIVTAESPLIGQTVHQARMRSDVGITVIGLRRGQKSVTEDMLNEVLRVGDTLLITGFWDDLQRANQQHTGLVLINKPREMADILPAASKAPQALAILIAVVLLMMTDYLPNVHVVLLGVLLMGLFGIIDMPGAYRAISWKSLILIVGMMPFAMALQRTGGIDMAADALLAMAGDDAPRNALALIFIVTAVLGMFISNTATAILMAPVAMNIAGALGVSPLPLALTVCVAASTAFMTPVSSPVNTLVVGPGKYIFADFIRVGVPLSILVFLISVILIPILLPF
jgi:di/tricarboxylate transporter